MAFDNCIGSMAILWSLVWLTSIGESPTKDVRISEEEREFIVSSIGPTNVQLSTRQSVSREFF